MSFVHFGSFIRIDSDLATAGQPSEEQLRAVAEAGFEVVINLGLLDPRYCLPDEAGLAQSLGLAYHHIPVDFQAPRLADLEQFFKIMDVIRGRKIFVHCAANKRASCFMGAYGEARLGWSREKANAFIHRVWQPDAVWGAFLSRVRQKLRPRVLE